MYTIGPGCGYQLLNTLIVWNSQMGKPVTIDKYCSSLDIMPTLANLFGLEYDSFATMGCKEGNMRI